ncbi:MAG: DUF378 domain-containing protein [Proteobacteria bacterium]|nr:DUF378 domain-containing protein [Pseudomonadota bacterium]
MTNFNVLDWVAFILVVVGGLNWGLVGLLNLNLVEMLFGFMPLLVKVIYIVVGLSALYLILVAAKVIKK